MLSSMLWFGSSLLSLKTAFCQSLGTSLNSYGHLKLVVSSLVMKSTKMQIVWNLEFAYVQLSLVVPDLSSFVVGSTSLPHTLLLR